MALRLLLLCLYPLAHPEAISAMVDEQALQKLPASSTYVSASGPSLSTGRNARLASGDLQLTPQEQPWNKAGRTVGFIISGPHLRHGLPGFSEGPQQDGTLVAHSGNQFILFFPALVRYHWHIKLYIFKVQQDNLLSIYMVKCLQQSSS